MLRQAHERAEDFLPVDPRRYFASMKLLFDGDQELADAEQAHDRDDEAHPLHQFIDTHREPHASGHRIDTDRGDMPKVSGSSSETPFGAPRPGSTPTRMPSNTPTTINIKCGMVTAMVKPCKSDSRFSIAFSVTARTRRRANRAAASPGTCAR